APLGGPCALGRLRHPRHGGGRAPRRSRDRHRWAPGRRARRGPDLPRATADKSDAARAWIPRPCRRGPRAPRMIARRALIDLGVARGALAAIGVILEAWTRAFNVPTYLFPAPSSVAARMATDASPPARAC